MTVEDAGGDLGATAFAGRYRLGEVLGVGGAATVYRAWDLRMNRHVAVKIYSAGVAATDQPPHRAEVAALAKLRHPGLVALYDAGVDAGSAYIVMQLVDGEPLSQWIRRERLANCTVIDLGVRLAGALAYIHDQGVIHRDVKPANVLVDDDKWPYLADFGVSLLVDATRTTTTGLVFGTPAFLAPEQVLGQEVGPAADVYALGLVLLEALTGRREYPGGAVEAAVARLHRSPEIPADLPDPLRSLLTAMTSSDVAARPDAAEVAARLARSSRSVSFPATPDVPVRPRTPRDRRRVLGALAAAAAALTLGALAVNGAVPGDPASITAIHPAEPDAAEQPAAQAPPTLAPAAPPAAPPTSSTVLEQVAVAPDRVEAREHRRDEPATTHDGDDPDRAGSDDDGGDNDRGGDTEQVDVRGDGGEKGKSTGGENKGKDKDKAKSENRGHGSDS